MSLNAKGVDSRSLQWFILLSAGFFFYVIAWAVTTQDPVGALERFRDGPAAAAARARFPPGPGLSDQRAFLKGADQAAFDKALGQIAIHPRKAGRMFWPLLARHPRLRPALAYYYYGMAVTAWNDNKLWKARELTRMAVAVDPKDFRAHRLLANTADRLQRPGEAGHHRGLSRTRPAWTPAPPDPEWGAITFCLLLLALVFLAAHTYRGLLGIDDLLRTKVFGLPPRRIAPAGAEDELDGPTEIQNLEQLRQVRQEKKKTITAILSAEAFLKDIQDAFDRKDYEKGVDLCAKAVELNDANSKKVSAICLAEGIRLFEVGDYAHARELLEVSLHFEPHVLEAHTCLGNCFIKTGDFEAAKLQYERVIEVDPRNGAAYYTLGVCYQKVGDLPRAKRSFEVAVQLDDQHANCHFYLAKLFELEKNYPAAIKHWSRFVELKPSSPHAAAARERLAKLTDLAGAGA